MVGTQKNLTEQVRTAYEAHKSATDCWKEGNVKDFWIDDNGNLCIMYDSGKWWHYKDLELSFPTWW